MFFEFGIKDFIDILLVAFVLYYTYKLMKASGSIKVFTGILVFILPSVIRRNISGMQRICTKRVRTVNQRPMPISITMRT